MFAEQMSSAPPPLTESLHWLTVTTKASDAVPDAEQVISTRVRPFADPLHWVIVASVVFAGNGSQPVVMSPPGPAPEPLH